MVFSQQLIKAEANELKPRNAKLLEKREEEIRAEVEKRGTNTTAAERREIADRSDYEHVERIRSVI